MTRLKQITFITFITFATLITLPRLYASVPPSLNVQGRLTDDKGVNREGNLTFVFTIYDAPAGGKNLWKRTYLGVKVRNGSFSVALGSPNGKDDTNRDLGSIFDGSERWVGIQVEGPGGTLEPELIPRQHLVTVPHAFVADKLTSPTVPIGTILDWFRPTSVTPIPDGYQICDGSAITDPASPMQGQNTPNLINKFTYGVSSLRVGESGGTIATDNPNINLIHNHTYSDVSAHTHAINDPGHAHGLTMLVSAGSGYGGSGGVPSFMLQPNWANTASAVSGTGITLNSAGILNPITASALGAITVMPKYFGVLKIIRIK